MALQNLQQYGCQTGTLVDFFSNKNETMFGSGYENYPEFAVLGGVIFKLNRKKNYCSSGTLQFAPASYYSEKFK